MVINASQDQIETSCNQMQILQGQFTLIELAVSEDIVDDLLYRPLDSCRGRIFQRPARGFNCIGEHNQGGLPGLGLGAGITKLMLFERRQIRTLLLLRLIIKETHLRRAVMLFDHLFDHRAKFVFFGEIKTVAHMGGNDQGTHRRRQFVVAILTVPHILAKIKGFFHLADIMIIRRHFGQEGVGIDRFCRCFDEITDDHRMVIGPRRLDHQFAQQRIIHVGEFKELDIGRITKQ